MIAYAKPFSSRFMKHNLMIFSTVEGKGLPTFFPQVISFLYILEGL